MAAEPQVLDNAWRLDRKLGEGGLAAVYAATHVRTGARVAIKLLHAQHAHDEDVRARFAREGYAANSIQHAGAVRVLGDGVAEGRAYLVMELVEGESLKSKWLAAGRRLPLDEVARVIGELLGVLAAAHAAGVVHRDVKPDNVLVGRAGDVRLVDFGIARVATAGGRTMTGVMLGTPAFMSPEQALARWTEVDARTDLFAVGATAWTMLSGQLVHRGSTVPEILVAAATQPVAPIRTVLPQLPEPIAQVIDWSLQFDRERRPADAMAMRDAWTRAVDAATRRAPLKTVHLGAEPPPSAAALLWPTPPPVGAPGSAPLSSMVTPMASQHGAPPPPRSRERTRVALWIGVGALGAVAIGGAVAGIVLASAEEPAPKKRPKTASSAAPQAVSSTAPPATLAATPALPPSTAPTDMVDLGRKAVAKFGGDATALQLTWTSTYSTALLITPTAGARPRIRNVTWLPYQTDFASSLEYDGANEMMTSTFKLSAIDWTKVGPLLEEARARARLTYAEPNEITSAQLTANTGSPELVVTVNAGGNVSVYRFDATGKRR